jgi:cysteinyl-tRNA synthetase
MSEGDTGLRLYNTLTRSKEAFRPIDPANVRMYVCGPTVYDYAHIGNARPAIVFDVLFRLLRHLAKQGVWDGGKGATEVTYVRNITDVDDKINARALRDYGSEIEAGRLTLNEAIRKVTEPTYEQYQKDVTALGCLAPTHQPRATEYVLPREDGRADMVSLIQRLIDRGNAYAAAGEVLFDTSSMADYGQLSKRPLDEQQAGARVAVDAHKKNAADFVLWKQSSDEEPGWPASFRLADGSVLPIRGRPGWHIECSAMSEALLWDDLKDRLSPAGLERPHEFDIHGGGLDLIFPHHENEIAQSRCAHATSVMANYWMHNGFLQVEGQKMSKSLGNFFTINELLATESFGGRKWPGEVLRLAMLMTHYREPIDFSVRKLEEAETAWLRWGRIRRTLAERNLLGLNELLHAPKPAAEVVARLADDLNTYGVFQLTQVAAKAAEAGDENAMAEVVALATFIGIDLHEAAIAAHAPGIETALVNEEIRNRLSFIREKNWAEADRIRNELLAQGIQLKDGKDPVTGDRITTWEVTR